MSGRRDIIVVDTNVWLDYLFGDRPLHAQAQRFIVEAKRQDLPLVIPSHAAKDVFFIFQQQIKAANRVDGKQTPEAAAECARQAAWAALELVMQLATVGPSDQSDAWIAAKYRSVHTDYEDNLVIACAMRLDARLLVTHDAALIKHSPVPTLSSHDAYELICAAGA